ncbi:hypothetical protein AOR_1_482114 [Paecilomyces variotii No. 5]|uniref:GH18 domain-containing protein n=1 Tax=Byssochlamys spectabilis (strain No. 5 / NBRC 109023) TaxID=1356009 RepID=V5I677_BYSSN|nr:hypothetical protein AOR_1_482114 [Paecilomyces variotii No. 5]
MAKPNNPDTDLLPIGTRLIDDKYDAEDCQAAVQGSRIPKTFDEEAHRLCTIHGIRHHYGFAQELRAVAPEFTRALNARDIMSGVIPTIATPDEVPYCIWYPVVPKETLRALVQRYPDMLYHVARACAVAGYVDLYKELDPLPEVHIAEEAGYASMQNNSNGSQQIYQHILSQPVKFEIMNDYTLLLPGRSTMEEVRDKLSSDKTLSIAAPASYWYLKSFPIANISSVVDYIVYMTYDLHGQWDWNNTWSDDGCDGGACLRSHVNYTEIVNSFVPIQSEGHRFTRSSTGPRQTKKGS